MDKLKRAWPWRAVSGAVGMVGMVGWAQAQTLPTKPADYAEANHCGASGHFVFDGQGACVAAAGVKDLKDAECRAAGFQLRTVAGVTGCDPGTQSPPAPVCRAWPGHVGKAEPNGQCIYTVDKPRSSPGDFVGDCFRIKASPSGTDLGVDKYYQVTRQEDQADDRLLTLVEGGLNLLPVPFHFGCYTLAGGKTREVLASTLSDHGASRFGWAYGALVMPYKYYSSTRSFVAGIPLGGYLGWRLGQTGSGIMLAAALTLSQVQAETLDPDAVDEQGQPETRVTGNVSTEALSAAVGVMFDVTKAPKGRPFKAGFFVGQDWVNESATLRYTNNRKTWIAIQLGFDFSDQ